MTDEEFAMIQFFGHMYVGKNGEIAIECPLCDSIPVDVIDHLRSEHDTNIIAQRIIKEYEASK